MIVGIVAVDKNFAIGKEGKLAWNSKADMTFFKETTTDNVVVSGRKTFESIGRPLPNRLNVVLSRAEGFNPPKNVLVVENVESVLRLKKYLNKDIFIIGGAEIYKAFKDIIDVWLVTNIPETVENTDTFMDKDFLKGFREYGEGHKLEDGLIVRSYYRRND